MKYTIYTEDTGELVYEHNSSPIPIDTGFLEYEDKIDWGILSGHVSAIETENIHIQHYEGVSNRNVELHSKMDAEVVEINFMLKGDARGRLKEYDKEFSIGTGEHKMFYTPVNEGVLELIKGETVDVFNLEFTPEHFLKLTDGIHGPIEEFARKVALHDLADTGQRGLHTTPQMMAIIYDIIHCKMPDNLKLAYIRNKAEELLILSVVQWQEELQHAVFTFSNEDRDKLFHLKSYLDTCPYEIPCLKELALNYGLNEYKLKKGFKQLFNNTVYGYLLELKLEKAKKLLIHSHMSIGEIAASIGYKYAQHFSTAFKRRYGYSPNVLRRNKIA